MALSGLYMNESSGKQTKDSPPQHRASASPSSGGGTRQQWVGTLRARVDVFIKLSLMLTEITQQPEQTPEQPTPTSDNNQIITGVTYALRARYFSLPFLLMHTMIKASVICSLWRPVEQQRQRVCSLIRAVH